MPAPYEIVYDHTCLLGEGPVWDDQRQSIIWVDILNGHIHEYHEPTQTHQSYDSHDMVGTVGLTRDGNFIAALSNGIVLMDRKNGRIQPVAHPESTLIGNRYNDGKPDPSGRFWVGSMSLKEEKGAGSLYRIDHDHSVHRMINKVSISNGLAWDVERNLFYYIDTLTSVVMAYDYDPATGDISRPRVVIRIPEKEGYPDGMTIDSEGKLWIAHWAGWKVSRWDPFSGRQLQSFSLPAAKITSCCFGGQGLSDLYITSARKGLSAEQIEQQPHAGALFVIRNCGSKGFAPFRYH
ncbi:SMP-30/gluconolactonase/LRE family protein [Flavihumibacter rivuli]|uniref:SMP-30/gluconolactonase/LRE family protein n=1 Tax=Flavihumibacter rivuli TaxID=2838156 RepID=UPI001BDEC9FE|nr:SMP-30/gluconolactonase/LRE family protein [Flavihumibacter rivuli]ULQ57777.1 SMP-30/gluconolactonase/LRE family protein [Flavihumibacter rivuli]